MQEEQPVLWQERQLVLAKRLAVQEEQPVLWEERQLVLAKRLAVQEEQPVLWEERRLVLAKRLAVRDEPQLVLPMRPAACPDEPELASLAPHGCLEEESLGPAFAKQPTACRRACAPHRATRVP